MPADRDLTLAYFAPGAGLGHLNRALAICLRLRRHGVDARILTNSPFAAGVAAITRFPIIRFRGEALPAAQRYIDERRPDAVVTDTFPLATPAPAIHIARRLKSPAPLSNCNLVIEAEPLSNEHRAILPANRVVLRGPIVLPPGWITPPRLPAAIHPTLVIHSGPESEIAELISRAKGACTVISPWPGETAVECYPASALYERARHIITGAGYNSMAELLGMRDRHTAVAFERRHDDQHARLREFFPPEASRHDGGAEAARAILDYLGIESTLAV